MAKKNVKNERDRKDAGFYPTDIDYSRHVKKLAGLLNAPAAMHTLFTASWFYQNYTWYIHLVDFTTIMPV